MESNDEEINFNEKKEIRKTHNLYILLSFLLIAIVLLIAVSINYYLIIIYHYFTAQIINQTSFILTV